MRMTFTIVIITILIAIGICSLGTLLESNFLENVEIYSEEVVEQEKPEEPEEQVAPTIVVHIAGEVNNPGVYDMDRDARLNDLVEAAGGFTPEAVIDNLNLAQKLEDGTKYVVDNEETAFWSRQPEGVNLSKGVNINTADISELMTLPGIGEVLAGNIIDYREANGDFSSPEEIRDVEGIGEAVYEKLKDSITIG